MNKVYRYKIYLLIIFFLGELGKKARSFLVFYRAKSWAFYTNFSASQQ